MPTSVNSFIRTLQLADPTPDRELVRRFVHGDRDAFELIVWRHSAMLLRLCRSMLRDHHRAEDATQASFLILARKAKTIGDGQTLAAWLHRVAVRVALRANRDSRLSRTLDKVPEPASTASNDVENQEQERLLHEEVDRLSEKYRLPVLLCFFEGLTHAEAAKRLNWPIGTVAGRLSRAKKLLEKRLLDKGVTVGITALFAGLTVNRVTAVAPSFVATILKLRNGDAVPATVLHLMNGGLQMMIWTKVKMSLAIVMLCGSVALTTAWAVGTTQQPGEKPEAEAAKPEAEEAVEEAKAVDAVTQLHDFKPHWQSLPDDSTIVMQSVMRDMYKFPGGAFPTDILDKDGNPILSWRVAMLPAYGEEFKELYHKFHLDEPWNSKHNIKLLDEMPYKYRISLQQPQASTTYFKVIADPGTPFDPRNPTKVAQWVYNAESERINLQDSAISLETRVMYYSTLGIVQAGQASPWTKPDSIYLKQTKQIADLTLPFSTLLRMVDLSTESANYCRPNISKQLMILWSLYQTTDKIGAHSAFRQIYQYTVSLSELDESLKKLKAVYDFEQKRNQDLLEFEEKQGAKTTDHKYHRQQQLEELIALLRTQNKQLRLELGMTD